MIPEALPLPEIKPLLTIADINENKSHNGVHPIPFATNENKLLNGVHPIPFATNENKSLNGVHHVPLATEWGEGKESEPQIKMKKELGLVDGVGIIVGVIIGSGIFISPTGVIQYSGSVGMSLVVWGISGCFAVGGALCYAELGTLIPKSGGDYAYIYKVYGDLLAFMYLWVVIVIIFPTRNAIIATTFANYILLPFFPNCSMAPHIATKLTAAMVICFLTWLNCTDVKTVTKVQDIFTVTKLLALSTVIITGFYYLSTGHTENYKHPFEGTNWDMTSLATAFYQGLFSFAGWNSLNFVVEELREPQKNLPKAIWVSLPLVSLVYFLANVSYFAVLTPTDVLSSSAVAVTFGDRMLGCMAWIIPFFVACSTFGGLNGGIFASSRIIFVGARQGHLPEALALINKDSLTPMPSLIFLCSLSLLMLCFPDIQALINYISFTEYLFVLLSVSGLLWLRYKEPDAHRPIKVYLFLPIVFFIICLFLVVMPILERPVELGVAVAILITGIPVYYLCIAWKSKPKISKSLIKSFTCWTQVLTDSLPVRKLE